MNQAEETFDIIAGWAKESIDLHYLHPFFEEEGYTIDFCFEPIRDKWTNFLDGTPIPSNSSDISLEEWYKGQHEVNNWTINQKAILHKERLLRKAR